MKTPLRRGGRRALVTGGAWGMGECTVRALAAAGASVVVADLRLGAAQALATEVGNGASALRIDVSDPDSVRQGFENIGALDILVNNAGVGHVGTIEETELEDWRRLFAVNADRKSVV